ncbi:MAG: J domain-containing protein [Candidatus Zixiibacteriota bacterium]|nr:MAG: J domain-containing protein [candidate division Zixibacteria bacterium]
MANKDYYDILGVARNASDKDIHQAYRRKARALHPDRNKQDPRAEDKFKDLGEAYRILSDPEKRRQYDMFGSVGGDYAPPPGWEQGRPRYQTYTQQGGYGPFDERSEFQGGGFEDLFESILGRFGSRARGGFRGAQTRPAPERGSDLEVELPLTVEELYNPGQKQIRIAVTRRCERCEGFGRTNQGICPECQGSGTITRSKTLRVRIPAGLGPGDVFRLAGQGHPAPDGIGPAGDLLVRLKVKPHPRYRINGRDLELDVEVPDFVAALGGNIEFEAPSGKVSLKLPQGTTSGKRLKIRGKGLPKKGGGRGNLFVNVRVTIPEHLTPEQKELYERLKNISV